MPIKTVPRQIGICYSSILAGNEIFRKINFMKFYDLYTTKKVDPDRESVENKKFIVDWEKCVFFSCLNCMYSKNNPF